MKVSVVVPVYNGETTIGACMDSLVRQAKTVGNVEIIVVDDASTDGTLAVSTINTAIFVNVIN